MRFCDLYTLLEVSSEKTMKGYHFIFRLILLFDSLVQGAVCIDIEFGINFHWISIPLMAHICCRIDYCVNRFLIGENNRKTKQFNIIRNSIWISWIHFVYDGIAFIFLTIPLLLNRFLCKMKRKKRSQPIFSLNFRTFYLKIKINWKFLFNEPATAFSAVVLVLVPELAVCIWLCACLSKANCFSFLANVMMMPAASLCIL